MAAGARPQGSMDIGADIVAQLGDVKAAAKLAKKEAREARKEIKKAAKEGKLVAPEIQKKLANAERLERQLKGLKDQERLAKEGIRQVQRDVENTQKTGRAIRFFMGAQAVQGLAQGQLLDPRNLASFAFGAQELIDANAERLMGTAFGKTRIGGKLVQGVKSFANAAPAVAEAVSALIQATGNAKRDALERRLVARQFATGDLTSEEYEFFANEQSVNVLRGKFKFLGDKSDLERLKMAQNLARAAFALKPKELNDAFEEAGKQFTIQKFPEAFEEARKRGSLIGFFETFGKKSKELTVNSLNSVQGEFERRLAAQREKIGGELSDKEKFNEFKGAFLKEIVGKLEVDSAFMEKLSAALALEATKGKKLSVGPKIKTYTQRFNEAEQQRMRDIDFMRGRQRVAIRGAIND